MSNEHEQITEEQAKAAEVLAAEAKAEQTRFQSVFSAVDRILNPTVDGVRLSHAPEAPPGWTDGRTVYLNTAALPKLAPGVSYEYDLAVWLGMNAHELGHTMHTPRTGSRLATLINKAAALYGPDLQTVEAIAEDQRQERLTVGTFSPLRVYLAAAVAHAISGTPTQNIGEIWPFVAGRTWLPADLRLALRELYDQMPAANPRKKRNGKRIAHLIGEYQRYSDPGIGDADEAYQTIVKLYEALKDDGYSLPDRPMMCNTTRPTKGEGEIAEIGEGSEGGVDSAGSKGDEKNLTGAKDEGEGDGEGGGEGEAAGAGGAEGENEGEGEGAGEGYDPDRTPGEGGDDQSSGGSGAGKKKAGSKPRPLDHSRLKRELRAAVTADLMGDVEINRDLNSMAKALELTAEGKIMLPEIKPTYRPASPTNLILARHLADQFRRFTDRALPYWERRVDQGRFKVARYLNSGGLDFDTMFDRFEPGMQEDLTLDVTLLVDRSGSMGGGYTGALMSRACDAAWVIHRAVEEAGGDTTVIFYDDRSNVMIQPGDRTTLEIPYVNAGGNTDPTDGLVAAYRRLVGVEARHKVVMAVTDGGWSRGKEAFSDIGRLRGVTTAAVVLADRNQSYASSWAGNLGAHLSRVMNSPEGLIGLVGEIVTLRMAQAMGEYEGA